MQIKFSSKKSAGALCAAILLMPGWTPRAQEAPPVDTALHTNPPTTPPAPEETPPPAAAPATPFFGAPSGAKPPDFSGLAGLTNQAAPRKWPGMFDAPDAAADQAGTNAMTAPDAPRPLFTPSAPDAATPGIPAAPAPFPGFAPGATTDVVTGDLATAPDTTNAISADDGDVLVGLKYEKMDLDEVLKQYSEWTGRALMKAPDVPAVTITLKCPRRIPRREALLAIEGILGMHGIALVPMGDNFLKVVPIGIARQAGISTGAGPLAAEVSDTGHLVSRIVELKHIEIAEAQGTLNNLISPNGKIIPLERINCLLITDSAINLKRIFEILELLDLPMGAREELRIFPVVHAKASEIQAKIEAIIADAQSTDNRANLLRQQLLSARMPFQPRRPGQPAAGLQPAAPDAGQSTTAERGLIQGKVKIIADDRTNTLIIIARPDQFGFFENIIAALDKQVEPDVAIKVIRLEYADSEKVVAVLNSLVGAAGSTDTKAKRQTPTPDTAPLPPAFPTPEQQQQRSAQTSASGEITIEGRLSSDVKIIADPRINALLIMATRTDMALIEDLLAKVDIMLSQVLIEVVIIEVGLDDKIRMGVDWLQRSMIAYNQTQSGGNRAFLGFAGTSREQTAGDIRNAAVINTIADSTAAAGSGLTYYFTLFDFNIDAVLNMLATTSDARILSTPIILTTDNTEAKILVGEKRPIVTSTSMSSGGVQQSAYQYTNIGIELIVTPRINKKGFVVMEIQQKIDNTGGDVIIDNNKVPIITTREFNASIAVNDGRTIVLGGLVSTQEGKGRAGIPFLSKIPLLGLLFRSDTKDNQRRELLVMITPYVLDTPEKVLSETARRHAYMGDATNMWLEGWSASDLAKPDPDAPAAPARLPAPEFNQGDDHDIHPTD